MRQVRPSRALGTTRREPVRRAGDHVPHPDVGRIVVAARALGRVAGDNFHRQPWVRFETIR
jgi:hypothetical protein